MKLSLSKTLHLTAVPSGSGLEWYNDRFLLVGDDTNRLFCLDTAWKVTQEVTLFEVDEDEVLDGRILKKKKPDLEATAIVRYKDKDRLLILGSGSREKKRDKGFLLNLSSLHDPGGADFRALDLGDFYGQLRADTHIKELNIEGAVAVDDTLLLFNRGGTFQPNHVIAVKDFFDKPGYRIAEIALPAIEGVASGISGAAYLPNEDILILCASAEVTDDSVNDGEIKGSAIAVITGVKARLKANVWKISDFHVLASILPKQKIESICVWGDTAKKGPIQLAAVADNDDGTSYLFHFVFAAA